MVVTELHEQNPLYPPVDLEKLFKETHRVELVGVALRDPSLYPEIQFFGGDAKSAIDEGRPLDQHWLIAVPR
jgi:hypothetical protein